METLKYFAIVAAAFIAGIATAMVVLRTRCTRCNSYRIFCPCEVWKNRK